MAAPGSDLFLIVGASNSSNSQRLVEVAKRAGAVHAVLIQQVNEINWNDLGDLRVVGLSAGASAPEIIVSEIIEAFGKRYDIFIELAETMQECETFPVNRGLRDVILTSNDMAFINGHGHRERNL